MQERIGEIGDYWLTKRPGSAQWCRTWYDANTRQTRRASLGTDDLQAAKVALWEWFAKYGRVGKQQAAETSLELVLVRYYQQHAEALPSAEMARVALGYWSDFFSGATVSEVTPARQREFMEWLKARRETPLSDGYIKRVLTVGKSALNRAYKEGEIDTVPFVIPGRDGMAREQILSVAESIALWNAAEAPHERMYLALAYCTLARPEAILGMHRSFADLDRRTLNQNPPGRRQTKKHRPVVPICDFLLPCIKHADDGPLVQWRGREIASFKTAWRKMRAAAGLAPDTVPKVIRHTMATHLRASGVDAAEIQGMLGHNAYSGKTEVYARYQPDFLSHAAAAIDGYMNALRVSCVLENTKAAR